MKIIDHPFVDGNGRTARALFYWAMASHGYWLAEFVSISRILKKSKASYARAFLYTETDENDTTYFILNQLRVFLRAIDELHEYLARKSRELQETEQKIQQLAALRRHLNERQLAVMAHALKNPDSILTIDTHRGSHGIAYETARTDLRELAREGLLAERKRGRAYVCMCWSNVMYRSPDGSIFGAIHLDFDRIQRLLTYYAAFVCLRVGQRIAISRHAEEISDSIL